MKSAHIFMLLYLFCAQHKNSVIQRVCVQRTCMCMCYLAESQTVFILVFVFDLKVIQRFSLGWSLTQGTQQLDVTSRQETMATIELAMVPVVIYFASQDDDVTFGKLEIAWFLAFVGVEGFTARQSWDILKNTNIYYTNKTLFNMSIWTDQDQKKAENIFLFFSAYWRTFCSMLNQSFFLYMKFLLGVKLVLKMLLCVLISLAGAIYVWFWCPKIGSQVNFFTSFFIFFCFVPFKEPLDLYLKASQHPWNETICKGISHTHTSVIETTIQAKKRLEKPLQ